MPVAPALTALQTDPANLRSAARDTGIKVVAALMMLFCLSLSIAFWQDQQATPRRLHEAAVTAHAHALFEQMQNELRRTDSILRALELATPMHASGDENAFARLAKSLSPALRDLQTVGLARVSGDEQVRTQLFRVGDFLDKEKQEPRTHPDGTAAQLSQLAERAAEHARHSGRLTLMGPTPVSDRRIVAIARTAADDSTNIALIDLDKWLDAASSPHAEWVNIALQILPAPISAAAASPSNETTPLRFGFEDLSPQVELIVTAQAAPKTAPPTIVGAAGIALFGVFISGLILLLGNRGNEAAATANLVGKALTESDDRLHRALQLTHDGIWEFDLKRRTLYLSGQARKLIAWQDDKKPMPAAILRRLPLQWRREVLRSIAHAAGTATTCELQFPLSDSMLAPRWVRLRMRGTNDVRGKHWLITGSLADISEEMSHASAHDRYRALLMRMLDAMPIPVAVKTADQKVVMLNERYATQLLGTLEAAMQGTEVRTATQDKSACKSQEGFAERMEELDQLAIATGEPQIAHEWLRTASGEEIYLRITRVLCDGLNGEPIVLGTYEDLTELQRQAQQQSALREYFERVFDLLPSPTYIKDANHRYILTNQAHARANKTTKEFMIGKRSADFSPDEADEVEAAERYLLETGSNEIHEKEYFLNSGNMQRNTIIRKVRTTDPAGNNVLLGTQTNVTILREAEADLRRQAEQQSRLRRFLQDVFDAVPHPLFVKDRQYRYIMTNRAHSESVGARMEDIIGKRSGDFVSEDIASIIEQSEEQLFTNAPSASMEDEYVLVHRNGQTRHTIIRKALCTNSDGEAVLVGVNTDITRLREAEAGLRRHRDQLSDLVREQTIDLVRAKEVAERANETKSSFLANMSHELRTPLHAILSFARLGESRIERLEPDKLHDYFNRIRVSGERLLSMLNDLLDLSKLESGRINLEIRPTTIQNILQETTHEFEAWLTARHLQLLTDIQADLPCIMVDAAKVGQVLRNLLSNAIKFSPDHGHIRLSLHTCEMMVRGDAAPAVEIGVADEGPGIPESELETVFEKFVQSTNNQRGMVGGTGLGLAICREIVAAHGGVIVARNTERGGAEFIVRLRVDRRAPRSNRDQYAPPSSECDAATLAEVDTEIRVKS